MLSVYQSKWVPVYAADSKESAIRLCYTDVLLAITREVVDGVSPLVMPTGMDIRVEEESGKVRVVMAAYDVKAEKTAPSLLDVAT